MNSLQVSVQEPELIEMGLELALSDTELAKYSTFFDDLNHSATIEVAASHQPHCRGATLHKGPGTFITVTVLIRGVTNSHLTGHQVSSEVVGQRSKTSCEQYDSR